MVKELNMVIQSIDKQISEFLKDSKSINTSDLGGIDYLLINIESIYSSRFLPEILKSIINEIEKTSDSERSKCKNILLTSLRFCNDEFSIKEVIHIIETGASSILKIEDSCFLIYLEESKNIDKNSTVRSWFLEAAFRSSLNDKSRRFKLISSLIDISVEDCNEYLRHVSKILGLSYSSWQEEELISKLEEIKDFNKGSDEVWFELGMCYLLNALNSETKEEALQNFILAKDHFKKAVELNSERPDGEAYEACISILLSLGDSQIKIDRNEKLDKITRAITIYNVWHVSENDSIWVSARNTEITNWYILIDKLDKLLIHLAEPSWFEPKIVIEKYLLNIYTASRTILKRNHLGGLEKIIQPKVQNSLNNEANQLFLLDKWITLQDASELGEIGKKLKQEINLAKFKISDTLPNSISTIAELPNEKQSEFQKFVTNHKNDNTNDVSIHIENIFNNSVPIFSNISDYENEEIKRGFNILFYSSLLFLKSRMDSSKTNFKELSYLFEQKSKPLESELQKDYYQFMLSALLHGNTSVEKSDVASGRVDVHFSYAKFNISAEIKRDWEDCDFDALKTKYLGQASEYSNTDAKLGFLIVLDLTPKPNGVKSIETNVKVEIVEKENDPIKRAIVVIVLPGMRKTPSAIKIKE
jgi:hypothetical protein